MKAPLAIIKFIAKSALNAVSGGVGGDFLDMCHDIWSSWGKDRNAQQRKADVEALVQAQPEDVNQQVKDVVREVAGDRPADVQLQLEAYLNQVPEVARRSLSRHGAPLGRTVPPSMPLTKANDLAAVLPRFKPGKENSPAGRLRKGVRLAWRVRNPGRAPGDGQRRAARGKVPVRAASSSRFQRGACRCGPPTNRPGRLADPPEPSRCAAG
jgi:hypothetical protein